MNGTDLSPRVRALCDAIATLPGDARALTALANRQSLSEEQTAEQKCFQQQGHSDLGGHASAENIPQILSLLTALRPSLRPRHRVQ